MVNHHREIGWSISLSAMQSQFLVKPVVELVQSVAQEIPVSGAPGKGPQHERGPAGCLIGVRHGTGFFNDIQNRPMDYPLVMTTIAIEHGH